MNKIKVIISILLCGGLFAACNNDDVENQEAHFVYMALPDEVTVSATEVIDMGNDAMVVEYTIAYGITSDKTATIQAVIEPDLSLVDSYNKSKSKNLLPLPATHLQFTETSITIPSGKQKANGSFTLTNLNSLPEGEFLLPVSIKSVNASNGFTLYEPKKTIYYVVSNKFPVLKGKWTFEDPADFGKATEGNALQLVGSGFTPVDDGPNGGKAVRIAKGSHFNCILNMAATSDGKVGEYTLFMDVRYQSAAGNKYYALYQTNLKNDNDATLFIHNSNKGVGVSNIGYSSTPLPADVWNRVAFSVKKGAWFRIYFDGVLVHEANPTDARYWLDPNGVILFGDNDGEDNDIEVAEVSIYESALSSSRISNMGGAGN
jgi:hypothetical protein